MRSLLFLLSLSVLAVPMASAGNCGGEPCGYIVPIMDLEFPDKQLCGGGRILYSGDIPEDCEPLMAVGESWTMDGHIRWYWDAQEEPTYPFGADPLTGEEPEVTISFAGTQSNPKWMDVKIEPSEIVVSMTDLYNYEYYEINPDENPMIWYNYRAPISVTITRTDDPDARWLDKIEDRKGVVPVFVKARSTASGDFYRESFGVEEFRFNACYGETPEACTLETASTSTPNGNEESPGVVPLTLTLALLGAAMVYRRRK